MTAQHRIYDPDSIGMENQGGDAPTPRTLDTEVEDLGDRIDAATDAGQNGLGEQGGALP